MPLTFDKIEGNTVAVTASGRLSDDDYQLFVPRMERLIEQWGRLRMLFRMEDFHGWDLPSAWEELRFHARHGKDLKRVAVVGDKRWEAWASKASRFFTGADVRYFDQAAADEAQAWIDEGW